MSRNEIKSRINQKKKELKLFLLFLLNETIWNNYFLYYLIAYQKTCYFRKNIFSLLMNQNHILKPANRRARKSVQRRSLSGRLCQRAISSQN